MRRFIGWLCLVVMCIALSVEANLSESGAWYTAHQTTAVQVHFSVPEQLPKPDPASTATTQGEGNG